VTLCDDEVARGLDCHECGHSLNCTLCCSNTTDEERARIEEHVDEVVGWRWLASQRRLQEQTFGVDFKKMSTADAARYLTWNTFAAFVEVAEVQVEFSWAPWAQDEPFVNRDRVRDEVIDALHFLGNMLVAVGVTDEELARAYQDKDSVIRSRQASGSYSKQKGSLGEGSEVDR
jgi:dimeric dUTPase (all-alpha-NTP-PPase superfamily)